mmetsp:Transcript_67613/g.147281  ORF Transcript_67613/g.147281 Transcript_67613/m.147281 type:complete len:110 (+) Transcript_67613:59-388(+)
MLPKRSMKKAAASMTVSAVNQSLADSTGLKKKDIKGTIDGLVALCAKELKKTGSFKFAGMLNMKLKKKAATKARKGINPFTKEPCIFKAKPASQTVRALPLKKLKDAIN